MKSEVNNILRSLMDTMSKIKFLQGREVHNQQERILLKHLKRKLANLKDKLSIYFNPKIYKITVEVNGNEKIFYLANVPENLIPKITSLKYYPDKIIILEIQELGKN